MDKKLILITNSEWDKYEDGYWYDEDCNLLTDDQENTLQMEFCTLN